MLLKYSNGIESIFGKQLRSIKISFRLCCNLLLQLEVNWCVKDSFVFEQISGCFHVAKSISHLRVKHLSSGEIASIPTSIFQSKFGAKFYHLKQDLKSCRKWNNEKLLAGILIISQTIRSLLIYNLWRKSHHLHNLVNWWKHNENYK